MLFLYNFAKDTNNIAYRQKKPIFVTIIDPDMKALVLHWSVDPVLCQVAGTEIRWYSLLFLSSLLWAWFFARWVSTREHISSEVSVPLVFWLLVGFYAGGKIGNHFFYATESFKGFSSFGAAIGMFLTAWIFCATSGRRHGISFLWLLDRVLVCGLFGAVPVRIGNFFNSELYGTPTDLPWGVIFERTADLQPRHPVQLYEAMLFIILFVVIFLIYLRRSNRLPDGFISGVAIIAASLIRFMTEFVKESSRNIDFGQFTLHTAQVLCIPLFLFGAGILFLAVRRKREMK